MTGSQAPWVTWFGDDFTGSAAVMEVLAFAGLPSVLFTDIPSSGMLARFADCRGIGIASTARSHDPGWMEANLPAPLRFLHGLGAPILHYKICSTFDSTPQTGSIGKAIEIGLGIRQAAAVPLLTAAPAMRRYQAFGNLFAATLDAVHRLDRHPVMAHHPVTPMAEADLLRHLSAQTDLPGGLIDLEALNGDPQTCLMRLVKEGARILSLDNMDAVSELAAGKLIWENRDMLGFVAGSQGVEYALVRYWQKSGMLAPPPTAQGAGSADRIVAVSGSVSPVTARQLDWAGRNGFTLLAFDASAACADPWILAAEEARLIDAAIQAAEHGASPLVHSASGHDGPEIARFRAALARGGVDPGTANRRVGEALGRILDAVLQRTGIRRAVISGGDTSGHGMRQLGLSALVARAPTVPGAALCTAYGDGPHDGLEIALKGGQMGSEDYFGWIRDGGGERSFPAGSQPT
ncbi:four-carbon acid sugar kinase family protein [Paracoccus onubensis]|uniref:four-carbon acid sugar kinase family protein n=1 Tax=Paracoccus onubensis TaxID=1675788 RepID=UPI002730A99B|nr:four-carbon acid sugar kinase family protein [Paracoccus onubensis]MDP0929339.1 four-carbon acid sugar kinase family protein [Paracoccus onubensis]